MAERTKAQQVDESGYTARDLATLQKKRVGSHTLSIGQALAAGTATMMTYAIFTPSGTIITRLSTDTPPTSLEALADYCAEVLGYADRD
jgi:hypothetical protein